MVPDEHLRANIPGIDTPWSPSRYPDDRQHIPERTPHGGQPSKKGDSLRTIGHTKGGLNSKLHIIALASQYGRYGYCRITALLREAGWAVNVKPVEGIWRRD